MNLKQWNQEHLLDYINELSDKEKSQLYKEIKDIDFELISKIFSDEEKHSHENKVTALKADVLSNDDAKRLFDLGLSSIQNNEVAVVLMAGGQGTRLGHKGPKGTFDIGLPSGKSLFHLQCDKLISLHNLSGQYIKWYIMTSEDNHQETVNHFVNNDYFGYSKNHIVFFKQDRLPLVLENGSIAMKSKYEINLAANGNGGIFSSLESNGLLNEMTNNGVKWVYLYGVDNAIAKVADPTFIGYTIESKKPIASKSVDKAYPEEKVGVICYRNGYPDIVEYSELDDELRYMTDENNQLVYRNGNILSHVFSLDFLVESVQKDIPYHKAHKKVNYIKQGQIIEPSEPNGYKFELFIFDMFKYANDMAVMSVKREEEFSPVKNKDGKDSPLSAKNLILNEHKRWLTNAGHNFNEDVELDTSKTYNGEGLNNINIIDIIYR